MMCVDGANYFSLDYFGAAVITEEVFVMMEFSVVVEFTIRKMI
jgi:hypothetical protein